MTDDKSLTLKQRKWLKSYLASGNATQAALEVYDTTNEESAAQIGWENMRKLDVVSAMEDAGLTTKMLFEKHKEGLEATKTISAQVIIKKGSPTSQANGELPLANSKTNDFIDVPDYAVRHKYLETAYKVKKILSDAPNVTVPVQVVFNIDEIIGLSNTPAKATDSDAGAIQPTV